MAKPDLGTKRICPETGRKFYDLNKDPIVSPYTGQSYPLSYFDSGSSSVSDDDEVEEKELDAEESGAEIVSREDAADEATGDS
ncbi:MAG: TIGR02300 family protein, partial [Neoaquamicrobium sediminum]